MLSNKVSVNIIVKFNDIVILTFARKLKYYLLKIKYC